jgi:hypothetical protein
MYQLMDSEYGMESYHSGELVLDGTAILKLIMKIGRECVDCISLAQGIVHLRALNQLNNYQNPRKDFDPWMFPVAVYNAHKHYFYFQIRRAYYLHSSLSFSDADIVSCERPCKELDWPMICRIKLTLEVYQTLSR